MTVIETVKVKRDAHGAICSDCNVIFDVASSQYWHWSKSMWMHRDGTGHKVEMFRIVR